MATAAQKKVSHQWTTTMIREAQLSMKELLANQAPLSKDKESRKARLDFIIRLLSSQHNTAHPLSELLLTQLIAAMSALVHHFRYGGLTKQQVQAVSGQIEDLLTKAGVPLSSAHPLAFLREEFHLTLSHIARKSGNNWGALWQQSLSKRFADTGDQRSDSKHSLAAGIRLMRLGCSGAAESTFRSIDPTNLDTQNTEVLHINVLRCLRMAWKFSAAAEYREGLKNIEGVSETYSLEIAWEAAARASMEKKDPLIILRLMHRSQPFRSIASYALDGYFWAMSCSSKSMEERVLMPSGMIRLEGILQRRNEYSGARLLQSCYDTEIPLERRIELAGQVFDAANKALTFEVHLLMKAAVVRWLIRSRLSDLRDACLEEYRACSRQVSQGLSSDLYGFFD